MCVCMCVHRLPYLRMYEYMYVHSNYSHVIMFTYGLLSLIKV